MVYALTFWNAAQLGSLNMLPVSEFALPETETALLQTILGEDSPLQGSASLQKILAATPTQLFGISRFSHRLPLKMEEDGAMIGAMTFFPAHPPMEMEMGAEYFFPQIGHQRLSNATHLMASGIVTQGRRSRVDDQTLARALEKYKGNQTKAAQEVGLTNTPVNKRVKMAKEGSPLKKFQEMKGKRGGVSRVDDQTLAQALEKYKGNQTKAAQEVGLPGQAVNKRIKMAKEGSPLKK